MPTYPEPAAIALPASETSFFRLESPVKITFVKNDAGKVAAMRIGEHFHLERLESVD
ncbi:MAG: hypothetical protein AB1894_15135 [Chloroflexota bacterium]